MSKRHKRILIVEHSENTRSVAESVLRQNGFEVISVATAEQAREVLQYSAPDLMVVGADVMAANDRPLYEQIQSDSRTSTIPLLLFDSVESGGLPFPDEVILSRPLDPNELLQRVLIFSGQAGPVHEEQPNPLAGADLGDDVLDEALGLDRIDVESSEEMDKTTQTKKTKVRKYVEKLVGMDHEVSEGDDSGDSSRVETRMIQGDSGEVPVEQSEQPARDGSATGGLEIVDDEYGMIEPESNQLPETDGAHDYDWFVNSIKAEAEAGTGKVPAADEQMHIENTASQVDPQTPPPDAAATGSREKAGGVEKFIDEFKEEMERIHSSDEPDVVAVKPDKTKPAAKEKELSWEETLERVSAEDMRLFSHQFAVALADRLASKILAKIDNEKLLQLIAVEMAKHAASTKPR